MSKLPLYFIGPRSENRPFMAELMNLILNDHVFWRRNYHPQDPAVISYSDLKGKENTDFQESLVNELFKLMAELKFDPPFFSPRYMAHMISEPLMPGLIAYMATLFYNPNNVASEASTVTMKYEMAVGSQLARLFGFNQDESFGHLTGGGTVANYQSLFYNINLRFLPLSIFLTLKRHNIPASQCHLPKTLKELCNIPYEKYECMLSAFGKVCEEENIPESALTEHTFGNLGLRGLDKVCYHEFGEWLPELKIIAPASHHYSWKRGAKLLGLGAKSLIQIKMDPNYQMDMEDLKTSYSQCLQKGEIILQTVAVYGTTELGSFDPIDQIASLRESYVAKGLYTPIHVDAAYGGYFSTLFKNAPQDANKDENQQSLRQKHNGLRVCESITVDPHKLGYSPYGAGAFLFRYGALKKFVAENAEYCFSPKGQDSEEDQLGKYILEGSKPGAAAAAVYFNHKVVPLTYDGYGRILEKLVQTGKAFYEKLKSVENSFFQIVPFNAPQSNIVSFYIVPKTERKASRANSATSSVAAEFGIKTIKGVQEYEYIVSNTTISLDHYKSLPDCMRELEIDTNKLCLIRMVFMNQWHDQTIKDGKNHLDFFLERLDKVLNDLHRR